MQREVLQVSGIVLLVHPLCLTAVIDSIILGLLLLGFSFISIVVILILLNRDLSCL
jgi:hypothetical protein